MVMPRLITPVICILSFACLWTYGCSDRDSSEKEAPKKVVVRIQRPAHQPALEQKKEKEQVPVPQVPKDESVDRPGAQGEETQQVQRVHPEGSVEAKAPLKPPSPEPQDTGQEPGSYLTQEGDTLFSISGNAGVFGDPFKWPCLLRLNLTTLRQLGIKPGFENMELPQGIQLRFFSPEQVSRNIREKENARWAVNIFSDKSSKRISRLAIKLTENDVPVYIVRTNIKGEIWLRLRTGFFKTKEDAKKALEKIKEITGLEGIWITRVSNKEFNGFAGYLE